eukprot:1155735-Pelagomonas_calceolata.AAC.5
MPASSVRVTSNAEGTPVSSVLRRVPGAHVIPELGAQVRWACGTSQAESTGKATASSGREHRHVLHLFQDIEDHLLNMWTSL